MDNFKWFNGKEFKFWSITGQVISNNKFSETHVSSSGGGGYVDPQHGGHVAAAQVSSTVTTVHEFWIKDAKGKDYAVNLRGKNIPLAIGQKITLVAGGLTTETKGYYVALCNHDANRHWLVYNGLDFYKACEPEVKEFVIIAKFLASVAGLLLIWYYISGYISLGIVVWCVYYLVTQSIQAQKSSKALDAKLEKYAEELLKAKQA